MAAVEGRLQSVLGLTATPSFQKATPQGPILAELDLLRGELANSQAAMVTKSEELAVLQQRQAATQRELTEEKIKAQTLQGQMNLNGSSAEMGRYRRCLCFARECSQPSERNLQTDWVLPYDTE